MKIYIAGIHFLNDYNHKIKTEIIINMLSEINKNALNLMGEDVITFVVLQEYAVTKMAIPNKEKKQCIKKLEEATKQYKNVILIPGSFSAYQKFSYYHNPEKIKNKIVENYTKNLDNPQFKNDPLFIENFKNTKEKFVTDEINNSLCLQNSAYILNSEKNSKKIKHKKSFPYDEGSKLFDQKNYFYYLGADSEIKEISINNEKIEVGLSICREHVLTPNTNIWNNPPKFHVIVSASVSRIEKNLVGAINIQADSDSGLTVLINNKHPKLDGFKEIKAFSYYPDLKFKEEKSLNYFSMPIGKKITDKKIISSKDKNLSSSLSKFYLFNNNTDNFDISKIPLAKYELPSLPNQQEGVGLLSKKFSIIKLPTLKF